MTPGGLRLPLPPLRVKSRLIVALSWGRPLKGRSAPEIEYLIWKF